MRGWRLIEMDARSNRIYAIQLESPASGDTITVGGDFFIDASYTGDLLAEAGAPFSTGRESRWHLPRP